MKSNTIAETSLLAETFNGGEINDNFRKKLTYEVLKHTR